MRGDCLYHPARRADMLGSAVYTARVRTGGVRSLEVYSHSRLRSFENCPRQFHFRYVLKIPEETEGIEAFVGKRVHEVLERLYLFVGQNQIPTLPQVLHRFEQLWDATYDSDRIRIVREGTPVRFYRDLGLRCIEHYYRSHYPFDRDETLGLEQLVEFSLRRGDSASARSDAEGTDEYRFQGIIDRVVRAPDGAIEIHDYKTGRYIPKQEELDEDRQLALYQIGVGDRYGSDRPVRLVWHYLQRRTTRTSTRTPEQLEALGDATIELIDQIRATTDYPPNKMALCDWCDYKSRCPAWNPDAAAAPMPATAAAAPAAASPGPGGSSRSSRARAAAPPAGASAPEQLDLL